jgi:hypothetical protein
LTGYADVVIQVDQAVIGEMVQAMYRRGVIGHYHAIAPGDRFVELLLGRHIVELVPTEAARPEPLARAMLPILYRARPLDDASALGTTATATATMRVRVVPRLQDDGTALIETDWRSTTRADVDVPNVSEARRNRIADDILTFARIEGSGSYEVPVRLFALGEPTALVVSFLDGAEGKRVASVGIGFGEWPGGKRPKVAGSMRSFLERDWAIAISAPLFIAQVRKAVGEEMGRLPPPIGPQPIRLPGADTILYSLDFYLDEGVISAAGEVGLFGPPAVKARYQADLSLALDAEQRLTTQVENVTVQVNEWYAQIFDYITGGRLTDAVARGVRTALATGAGGRRLTDFFSTGLLRELAAAGTIAEIEAVPTAETLAISPAGILVQGSVDVRQPRERPRAEIVPVAIEAGRAVLHAGQSWAPGGNIAGFRWEFGDGQAEETAGAQAAFVVSHEYATGNYEACVTVTDDAGEADRACVRVVIP